MTQTRAFMAAKCSTALLVMLATGCTRLDSPANVRLLVDDQHLPDVLTESRVIEPPPSLAGNRFLRG